jgi:PucR family transcriptional regulator, purine catabolism regulatory protein
VQVPVDLFVDCRRDGGEAVASVLAADAAGEIEEPPAIDVLDPRALGTSDDEPRRADAKRDESPPLLQHALGVRSFLEGHLVDYRAAAPAETMDGPAKLAPALGHRVDVRPGAPCVAAPDPYRFLARPSKGAPDLVLSVRDIADMSDLDLRVVAGSEGLANDVRWLHVSELPDPTGWLEGGELLLTTGLGVGDLASTQRSYVGRLAAHELAGLGFGLGFGFADVPAALVEEANRLGFPVLAVPYDVPFIAITKAAFTHLANEDLERVTQALEVHERLSQAVLEGRGVPALLAILCDRLGCSLALVDGNGRTLGERHAGPRLPLDDGLQLPVVVHGEHAVLRAARDGGGFSEYDRLVLHHGQTALAFELSRRRAVSAAELRLAGDLLEDLEHDRLDEREIGRRIAAFGLDPARHYAALLALPRDGSGGERVRLAVARELDARGVRYVSTARLDRAAFLLEAAAEPAVLELADAVIQAQPEARVGVGRPASGRALGRSLLEARAALDTGAAPVASYRDLGSFELLLGLPDAALEAFVDRVLGPVGRAGPLVESLRALLETGCRWSEAAVILGVHRHTLRYRMERLREQTGRHPDSPSDRMELWLAVKAAQALASREEPLPAA